MLSEASNLFDAAGLTAYATAIRGRTVRLDGAAPGWEVERIVELLWPEEIGAPDRMIALLVPGLLGAQDGSIQFGHNVDAFRTRIGRVISFEP
jgi:hypothetical protein